MARRAKTSAVVAGLLALAIGGCFSPDYQAGLACTESGLCPSGQSCQDGICVAGTEQPTSSDAATTPAADGAAPGCGNGVIDNGETCDDTNTDSLDGCSEACAIEAGYDCFDEPSVCSLLAACPTQDIVSGAASFASCKEYFDAGYRASGRYLIDVDGDGTRPAFPVLCDMATAGGGWTIVVNNVADAVEPDGCLPRLATVDGFVCGTPGCDEDFAVPVHGVPFTELVWAERDADLQVLAHNRFSWAAPQTLPNQPLWSLSAEVSNQFLVGLEAQGLIECRYMSGNDGLVRVANENPRNNRDGFTTSDVVTFFDQDNNTTNPGKMSFTDTNTAGLDDFQDGFGCEDDWQPIAKRGAATMVMIR